MLITSVQLGLSSDKIGIELVVGLFNRSYCGLLSLLNLRIIRLCCRIESSILGLGQISVDGVFFRILLPALMGNKQILIQTQIFYSNFAKYSNFKLLPQQVFILSVRQLQFFPLPS